MCSSWSWSLQHDLLEPASIISTVAEDARALHLSVSYTFLVIDIPIPGLQEGNRARRILNDGSASSNNGMQLCRKCWVVKRCC